MTVKLLTEQHLDFLNLKGGCAGSSESTLVKMPHCWKSHGTAHLFYQHTWDNTSENGLRIDRFGKYDLPVSLDFSTQSRQRWSKTPLAISFVHNHIKQRNNWVIMK